MKLQLINILNDLTPPLIWRFSQRLKRKISLIHSNKQTSTNPELVEKIFLFFSTFQDFRTNERCSAELGVDLSIVEQVKGQFYRENRLGTYSLGLQGPPHKLMREHIKSRFGIRSDSLILEIGPGANPLFPKKDYPNCFSVDKYGIKGQTLWYGNMKNMESVADFQGSYSTLDSVPKIAEMVNQMGGFDVVAGCHSFEHETCPLKGLRNILSVLRDGGIVILFVPDGWSDDNVCRDPTHTMYFTPDMVEEFFDEVGGFKDLNIEPFRPNLDIMISAVKDP